MTNDLIDHGGGTPLPEIIFIIRGGDVKVKAYFFFEHLTLNLIPVAGYLCLILDNPTALQK